MPNEPVVEPVETYRASPVVELVETYRASPVVELVETYRLLQKTRAGRAP